MDKIPGLNDDDIEKILHPNNLFTDELRPLGKESSSGGGAIEDIINPSLDPQSISPANENIADIPHEPGQHLIHRIPPVGIYPPHQDERLNNQLLPTKIFRNQQQAQQPHPVHHTQQVQPPQVHSARHTKARPAFVNKVWSMLNDESNINLIQWSPDGKSFIVVNREEFVHEILPKYFKHSNFASFVRQLNMYGWHKVQDVRSGSIQNSADDKWQFENEYFIRGREDLLEKIVRQKSSTAASSKINSSTSNSNAPSLNGTDLHLMSELNLGDTANITALLGELEQIKYNQVAISKDLLRINKDNEMLWKENMMARERHRTQQQALEKILRFLASLVPHMDQKMITEGILNNEEPLQDLHTGLDASESNATTANTDILDHDFLRNLPKSRFLLKNRTNSSVSNPEKLPMNHEDSARISEIPFDEEEEEEAEGVQDHKERPNISGDETVSFLNHLQSNIDEQDARIQHLEDMVQVMSPSGNNQNQQQPQHQHQHQQQQQQQQQPNFDLQDYYSPIDSRRLGNGNTPGLSPLLPSDNDDLIPLQGTSPNTILQDLAAPHGNAHKRYIEHQDHSPTSEPMIEEITSESPNNHKRHKR